MELVEQTRERQHHPGKTPSFYRYSMPLTRSRKTGQYWKYSDNYIKEKQIQQIIWGELKDVKTKEGLENPLLIIHEKEV